MGYDKTKSEVYDLLGGMNSKASPYDNDVREFRDLTNYHFYNPGSLTSRWGTSLYTGATIAGRITGGIEFERLSGASYLIVTANTTAYQATPLAFNAFKTGLLSNAPFDFVTFVDRLFSGNGQDFFKYDGVNSTNFSLPPGDTSSFGVTAVIGGGLSGIFEAGYGYLNDRGYFGPSSPGVTISLNGITFGSIKYYGMTTPSGFGVSNIALYRTNPGAVDLTGTTLALSSATTVTDTGFSLTTRLDVQNLYFTLAPKYLELYNNQLFLGGFSSMLSTVFWSNIGEPEGIDPTFNAEFRTNDGDKITGLKSYNGALIATKERSVHRVVGDDPSNFLFQEISDQYGCVSNRAMVQFENLLWFLDPKGIVEFNGANIKIISNKMEEVFKTMNVDAARENAVAIHVRAANEVWFAIPINGATMNNCIVFYDYLSQQWGKDEGNNISSVFEGRGVLSQRSIFYGSYTGSLNYYSASLFSDNGRGITAMMDTAFHAPRGQTTESMWRRFYLNVAPISGVTLPIDINFKANYGASILMTRTMYQLPYQSRVDFGISSRTIAAQVVRSSASYPIQVFGYSFESRFQRGV